MRIGIDARFYGPFGKGLGRYTEKLIQNLAVIDDENEYVVFLKHENWDRYQPANSRFKKVLADYRWYTLAEQMKMPGLIKSQGLDLMHFPHFNVPYFFRQPYVVTIHDLILTSFPTKRATTLGAFRYKIKRTGYRLVIKNAVRQARKVITISNFSKGEIVKELNVPPDKIQVIYESVDKKLEGLGLGREEAILKKLKINEPFFLYVGNAYPHKNLERLLRVYKKMLTAGRIEQLVLVGKKDYFFERLIREAKEMDLVDLLQGGVVFTDFVEDDELASLYRRAKLYVFPSLYEGFGLPPLEAMIFDLPVIVSRGSCFPEILGEAAAYFDPQSEKEMTAKIIGLLDDKDRQQELVRRGRELLAKYSWEKCAAETLKVYQEALS